ncbi:MAG: hypothetical protein HOV80_05250 [Polyangiaceae bacterium]|nr:hypothetical protein [Polyangiaceae bacterium]
MSSASLHALFVLPILLAAIPGCVPVRGSMPAQTWRPGENEHECRGGAADDATSSAWRERDRLALRAKLERGEAAVVSALGCRVEVLQQCHAGAPVERAELDGVSHFAVEASGVLAQDLDGACTGATHVVESAAFSQKGRLMTVALAPLSLDGFDVSGTWTGVFRQPGGPYETYELELELVQHGDRVTGSSRVATIDGEYWGNLAFEGRLEGNTLYFADAELVDDNLGIFLDWCMKGGYTVVDPRKGSMGGAWRAFACAPGTLELEQVGAAAKAAPVVKKPVAQVAQ